MCSSFVSEGSTGTVVITPSEVSSSDMLQQVIGTISLNDFKYTEVVIDGFLET